MLNKKGFTLIELVMIIVILGILAAIAIPRYVDLARDAKLAVLDGAAGAIKSSAVIQLARTKTANSWTTIIANTELDSNIVLQSGAACNSATLQYSNDATTTKFFSISSAYCSG